MKNTTADVPPSVTGEYAKARRPTAVSQAAGDGYTMTKKMQKGSKAPSQFGLPKSPGLHLKISIRPDTDHDEPKMRGGKYRDTDNDKM